MKDRNRQSPQADDQKSKIRERYKGVDESSLDVIPAIPREDFYHGTTEKRVAVYARVSTDDPRQTSSYELQKNHYTDLVSRRPDWNLTDIYADEGISGTSLQHRNEFLRMINDCNDGKVDLIVTKSVSRFARNIIDCIGYIRKLKSMKSPIGVFFETENIYTLDPNSEMSLSFIATLAQEESHTKSEIMNASIEMRFKRGIFLTPALLGYDQDDEGNLVINEEEAKTVRFIFFLYLYGYTSQQIADLLTKLGRQTKRGNTTWSAGSIMQILQNERHCGDVLARKTWTPNYLDHRSKKNNKDRNQYRMKNHHESIISRDDFIMVQRLIANAKYGNTSILPELHVIKDGILKGFVSINPRWASFRPDDYYEACHSAYYDEESKSNNIPEYQANEGDFDLRGYEVVRGAFFDSAGRTCVTISIDGYVFSTATVRNFNDTFIVELLIHPEKCLLAIRPATKETPNGIRWSKSSNGKAKPKPISGSASLPTIFALLGWDPKCKYKILGTLRHKGTEQFIVFNLKEPEIFIPKYVMNQADDNGNPETDSRIEPFTSKSKKQILAYPADWIDGFGANYYSTSQSEEEKQLSLDNWNVNQKGEPYKESGLNVTNKETIQFEIETMINEMKETNNE